MTDEQMVEEAFLAVMNANDRELPLPLSGAWAERNLLKRRIAVAVRFARAKAREEALEEVAKVAKNWPDRMEGGGIAYAIRALKDQRSAPPKAASRPSASRRQS